MRFFNIAILLCGVCMFWWFLGLGLSWAGDVPPIQVVFMCTAEKANKQVALFKQGDNFIYQYGVDMAAPELQLVRPSSQVIKEPWNGIGRYIWDNITLKNKEYSYTVRHSYDKIDDIALAEVSIAKNGAFITSVKCDSSKYVVNNLSLFAQ